MVYSPNHSIINKITKPTSNVSLLPLTSIALASAGAEVITEDDNNQINNPKVIIPQNQEIISLWQFLKLYTIGDIPIIDFCIVYVILYVINSLYLHYDYKIILVLTVPITIIYNILTNKRLKISIFMVVAIIVSMYFLFTMKFNHKTK